MVKWLKVEQEVKLKNLSHNKTETKNVAKVEKRWNLSKLVTNVFASLMLVILSAP